jgi:hypothetical protein
LIVTQPADEIAQFVAGGTGSHGEWGPFTALGKKDSKGLTVGIVYNLFTGSPTGYQDCCMHIAARPNAKWCTHDFIYHAFAYPFTEMGCERVTGLVGRKNKSARKFFEKLGFEYEACLKRQRPGDDTIVYRMFKENCKWIKT